MGNSALLRDIVTGTAVGALLAAGLSLINASDDTANRPPQLHGASVREAAAQPGLAVGNSAQPVKPDASWTGAP
jgi:hypothetical protein